MCVDRIPATEMLDPGDEHPATRGGPTSQKPVAVALQVGQFLTVRVRHGLVNLIGSDASLWVVLLDVHPIGSVPNDRPIVHDNQYTPMGYTPGKKGG